MRPKVILHNSMTLDGSFLNFEVDLGLHYQLAAKFNADAHLIGSNTAASGIEMGGEIPGEVQEDRFRPAKDNMPWWFIIDTKGKLNGKLHILRRFEFCRDVVIIASHKTPKDYIEYLKERNYDYYIAGKDKADLKEALEILKEIYDVRTVMVDTGRELGNLLLDMGLVDEVSLLISPSILGKESQNLFANIQKKHRLQLSRSQAFEDHVWLIYKANQ